MANVVHQFRDINLYLAGDNYAGQLDEFHPPQLQTMIDWYRAAGMDAPIPLDMGMDAMASRMLVNGYQPNSFTQFGLADINATQALVLGGLEDTDGATATLSFTMRGRVAAINMERARGRGEVPRTMIQMGLTYYMIEHSAEAQPLIEIDVMNMVRKINGIDRLAELRAALGL